MVIVVLCRCFVFLSPTDVTRLGHIERPIWPYKTGHCVDCLTAPASIHERRVSCKKPHSRPSACCQSNDGFVEDRVEYKRIEYQETGISMIGTCRGGRRSGRWW